MRSSDLRRFELENSCGSCSASTTSGSKYSTVKLGAVDTPGIGRRPPGRVGDLLSGQPEVARVLLVVY